MSPVLYLLLCLLLHHRLSLSTVNSATFSTDVAALKAFKAAIKPSTIPPWSCLGSWDFTTSDPCSYPKRAHFVCGLTCSSDPDPSSPSRVISITLDSVGYSGTLTPLVSQLTQLVTLDLGQNSFHGTIPPSLSSLSLLQTLTLRTNSFSGSLPSSIGNLKSLQELDLSGNFLSGYLPNTLFSLSKLTRLDLSFNKFSGGLPKLPPNLLELAIKASSLSGSISKSSFDGLTQLETLELSANSFTGILQSWLFKLPSLQQINLSNNSLTGVEIYKPNKGYSELVAVDLGFNKIEGYVPANFSEYPVLASLSLRYNKLRGPIPLEFSKKGTLKRLYLDGNYLTGTPPVGFFAGGESEVAGSFGDNCLRGCPASSQLCLPSQKPTSALEKNYKQPRIELTWAGPGNDRPTARPSHRVEVQSLALSDASKKADRKFEKKLQFYSKVREAVASLSAKKAIEKAKLRLWSFATSLIVMAGILDCHGWHKQRTAPVLLVLIGRDNQWMRVIVVHMVVERRFASQVLVFENFNYGILVSNVQVCLLDVGSWGVKRRHGGE
ncbi:hypothetical protein Cgig2_001243 [Carnegiea gigantea]|uniref:Uncharacterized protein n=1 Tax=Carnegiea gigantea TaxID=171969 RepID=A0A9Q1K056_9CARY|nr:hypothetical protein Cgig2_001243 [Carnegiea gigantea]